MADPQLKPVEPQRGGVATKGKPFNAEERSKQRKDEESQKLTTETRRKSCLIYKPLNKSLFEEGQKQKLATKDTEEKQRSQRKIWGKQVTKIRRKPQRIRNCSAEDAEGAEQPKDSPLITPSTLIKPISKNNRAQPGMKSKKGRSQPDLRLQRQKAETFSNVSA